MIECTHCHTTRAQFERMVIECTPLANYGLYHYVCCEGPHKPKGDTMSTTMGPSYCDKCGNQLEDDQIGLCEYCLHPQTDAHLAGCVHCMYVHDKALPDVEEKSPFTVAVAKQVRCECSDTHCPAHMGSDACRHQATEILFRVDTQDETGTAMCDACGDDAFSSGLFTTKGDSL